MAVGEGREHRGTWGGGNGTAGVSAELPQEHPALSPPPGTGPPPNPGARSSGQQAEMRGCGAAEKGLPQLEGFPSACATFSQVSGGRRDAEHFWGGHKSEGHGCKSPENSRGVRGIIRMR